MRSKAGRATNPALPLGFQDALTQWLRETGLDGQRNTIARLAVLTGLGERTIQDLRRRSRGSEYSVTKIARFIGYVDPTVEAASTPFPDEQLIASMADYALRLYQIGRHHDALTFIDLASRERCLHPSPWLEASVLSRVAWMGYYQQSLDEARRCCDRVYHLYEQLDDLYGMSDILFARGLIDTEARHYSAAAKVQLQCAALCRKDENRRDHLTLAWNRGYQAHQENDLALAHHLYKVSTECDNAFGQKHEDGYTIEWYAALLADLREDEAAVRLSGIADAHRRRFEMKAQEWEAALYRKRLSHLEQRLGSERYQRALSAGARITAEQGVGEAIELADRRLPSVNSKDAPWLGTFLRGCV